MDEKVEKLFRSVKESTKGLVFHDKTIVDLIQHIKSDKEMLSASNSYCVQCGLCCKEKCKNKETGSDGLTYCLLHDESGDYPNGKKTAPYEEVSFQKFNPKEWAKPLLCHTCGPHTVFLSLVKEELTKRKSKYKGFSCQGSINMFKDYKKFSDSKNSEK